MPNAIVQRSTEQATVGTGPAFGMDLLGFSLPEFTRISWASDRAHAVWAERISRILKAWQEIEWRSVQERLRCCAAISVKPAELPAVSGKYARSGLCVLPVAIEGSNGAGYANASSRAVLGAEFSYRTILGNIKDVSSFQTAWDKSDQDTIGELLGYPVCCRQFFKKVWVEHGLRDTSWPMVQHDANGSSTNRLIEVSNAGATSVLWRWLGVRAVFHLPCAFDCQPSQHLAAQHIGLGIRLGFEAEMSWLKDILDWPVEWSALHGIAELKTPILRACAATDATAHKHVIRVRGNGYPDEGAMGLGFPYQRADNVSATQSRREGQMSSLGKGGEPVSHSSGAARPVAPKGVFDHLEWRRLAVPQMDGYDTKMFQDLRGMASQTKSTSPSREMAGGVRLAYCYGKVTGLTNAEFDHPNIDEAFSLLEAWPIAAAQFRSIIHTVHPLLDPSLASDSGALLSGCRCHSAESMPGTLWASINCPWMLAEAFVHELAHQKLFLCGVLKESAQRLIVNPASSLYKSPIIVDRKRPMTAVVHGEYAFAHVLELDIHLVKRYCDDPRYRASKGLMLGRVAKNVSRLAQGYGEIIAHVEVDEYGRLFMEALLDWINRVLAEGRDLLAHMGMPQTELPPVTEEAASEDGRSGRRIGEGALLQPSPGVRIEGSWDSAFLYVQATGQKVSLNSSARLVWDHCNGQRSVGEIASRIAERYGMRKDRIAIDVQHALESLLDKGFLRDSRNGSEAELTARSRISQ